jgi:glucosyl-3-phosphoglycerate synthase
MTPVAVLRTFHVDDFDAEALADAKGGRTISVCLPARNEAATVGPIVEVIRTELVDRTGLIDELLVIDDHSEDGTARIAAEAGARVVVAPEVLADHGEGHGKGEALWKSLHASTGDLIVWCDADIRQFDTGFVVGLVGPLVRHPDVAFVKGYYERPVAEGGSGGGRVTELVARPIIALLHPELAPVVQPLAGEYGGRRDVLERLPFVEGYGVDLALLIDVARLAGVGAIAQVDLGVRVHRNRTLAELGPQALAVLHAALHRADPDLAPQAATLVRPGTTPVEHALVERPPLVTLPEYRTAHAADRPRPSRSA